MMGIFHLLMVYMSILNKQFSDAGLRDALAQSSIIAEGSVEAARCGKSYNRGVRLYKVFYEALNRLLLKRLDEVRPLADFIQPINETGLFSKDDIIKFKDSAEFTHPYNRNVFPSLFTYLWSFTLPFSIKLAHSGKNLEITIVFGKGSIVILWLAIIDIKNIILINSYLDLRICLNSSEFKLQQFWMRYLQMVELLLSTIYSVRLGKWDLLLKCICKIIPFAFVYEHVNYACYLPAMLGEMLELKKLFLEVHQQFRAGKFAVQLTNDNPFSRCETDKVIETTLNKDTKTPGGTTGFSANVNAVHRWEINAGYRADISMNILTTSLNYTSTKIYHHQESKMMKVMYHQSSQKHSST